MKMLNIQGSSAIAAVGYDEKQGRLDIEFKRGEDQHKSRKYKFCGVPAHIFNGLLYANSKGDYYYRFIRNKYLCL